MVFARDHDRQPLGLARLGKAVVHLEAAWRSRASKRAVDLLALARRDRVEDHPHEEAALVARVLVGVDDVEPGVGEEAADARRSAPAGPGRRAAGGCRGLGDPRHHRRCLSSLHVTMRITAAPDGMTERIGLMLNQFADADRRGDVRDAGGAGAAGRAAHRDAGGAGGGTAPAGRAGRAPRPASAGTELVLDVIASLGHVELQPDGSYEMTARARRWLDPGSDHYLGDFLADTAEYWQWWQRPRGPRPRRPPRRAARQARRRPLLALLHPRPVPARPAQLRRGRQGGAAAAGRALAARRRRRPRRVLDGALPPPSGLKATIVDLPGSARIGREIVSGAGMEDRVHHVEGDMFEADFGGPHDGALCFNIVHHLTPEQAKALFARIRAVLRPGAPLCVLELYDRPEGQKPDSGSILGLFFHLTSGADTYTVEQVSGLACRLRLRACRRRRPSAPCRAWRCSAPRPSRSLELHLSLHDLCQRPKWQIAHRA